MFFLRANDKKNIEPLTLRESDEMMTVMKAVKSEEKNSNALQF